MNSGLEQQRTYLLQRCAWQREQLGSEINYIEEQLGGVQRGIRIIHQLATLPGLLVFGSVLTVLAITGRGRTLQLITTGMALWAGVRRLRQGRAQLAQLLPRSD